MDDQASAFLERFHADVMMAETDDSWTDEDLSRDERAARASDAFLFEIYPQAESYFKLALDHDACVRP